MPHISDPVRIPGRLPSDPVRIVGEIDYDLINSGTSALGNILQANGVGGVEFNPPATIAEIIVGSSGKIVDGAGYLGADQELHGSISLASYPATKAGIRAAINDAIADSKILYIPPGTWTVDASAPAEEILPVNGNLTIVGAGSSLTTLKIGPDTVTQSFYGIRVNSGSLRMSGITIDGPNNAGPIVAGNHTYYTKGIQCVAGTGDLILNDVIITGKYLGAVDHQKAPAAGALVRLTNCYISAESVAVLIENEDGNYMEFRSTGSMFFDTGFADGGTNHGDVLYIDPNTSVNISHCIFYNNDCRYNVHLFRNVENAGDTRFCSISNCSFYNCSSSLILTNRWITTQISNCSFSIDPAYAASVAAVVYRNSVTLSNCTFSGPATADGVQLYSVVAAGTVVTINDTTFIGCQNQVKLGAQTAKISACTFSAFGTYGIFNNAVSGTIANISNCDFSQTGGSGSTSFGGANTVVDISRCQFDGDFTPVKFTNALKSADVSFCRFNQTTVVPITSASPALTITGIGNKFAAYAPDCSNAQSFSLCQGLGVAVASAATTQIDANHDTFHVTGVDTINTLRISSGYQKAFCTRVFLIADGAFSLSAAGNIVPKSVAARTVGEAIALVYDPVAVKWYETGW